MSEFYRTDSDVILNLDKILYIRKNGFCVDVIYGMSGYNTLFSFNNTKERDDFFDKLSRHLEAVTEYDLR